MFSSAGLLFPFREKILVNCRMHHVIWQMEDDEFVLPFPLTAKSGVLGLCEKTGVSENYVSVVRSLQGLQRTQSGTVGSRLFRQCIIETLFQPIP